MGCVGEIMPKRMTPSFLSVNHRQCSSSWLKRGYFDEEIFFLMACWWVGVQKTFLKIKRTCFQQFQHLESLGNTVQLVMTALGNTVQLVMTATTQNHKISRNLVI
jgi:hypothetical protein